VRKAKWRPSRAHNISSKRKPWKKAIGIKKEIAHDGRTDASGGQEKGGEDSSTKERLEKTELGTTNSSKKKHRKKRK